MHSIDQNDLTQRTVADTVSENYALATVFKRYGIDFCCGGGRTIEEACNKKGVDVSELLGALEQAAERSGAPASDPREWEVGFLVDYITNVHHRYVREQIPALLAFSRKVAKVHGAGSPELIEIAGLVHELAGELGAHLVDEEEKLFPYARQLATNGDVDASNRDGEAMELLGDTIGQMIAEHDRAGDIMKHIRELTNGFQPPEHACNTYRALYSTLEDFETDLHRHVHLENNVLFPKVIELESELSLPSA
ncbi:MAG: iron-sulfur cluster repair di-iron protein [Rhodothermales bacterium]